LADIVAEAAGAEGTSAEGVTALQLAGARTTRRRVTTAHRLEYAAVAASTGYPRGLVARHRAFWFARDVALKQIGLIATFWNGLWVAASRIGRALICRAVLAADPRAIGAHGGLFFAAQHGAVTAIAVDFTIT
jgi:hypothetical protein